jgi:hypothetical protein
MPTKNEVPITKISMSRTLVIMQRIQTVVNVKAAVSILPNIGDEIVVPKSFLVIHDPHNILYTLPNSDPAKHGVPQFPNSVLYSSSRIQTISFQPQ